MATHISAGGSANVVIDGSNAGVVWDLTGLDNSGRVLDTINVKIKKGLSPALAVQLDLPTIKSINGRNVTFNIDFNDFAGVVNLYAGVDNFINGVQTFTLDYPLNSVVPVSVGSSDNWVLPVLAQLP